MCAALGWGPQPGVAGSCGGVLGEELGRVVGPLEGCQAGSWAFGRLSRASSLPLLVNKGLGA